MFLSKRKSKILQVRNIKLIKRSRHFDVNNSLSLNDTITRSIKIFCGTKGKYVKVRIYSFGGQHFVYGVANFTLKIPVLECENYL